MQAVIIVALICATVYAIVRRVTQDSGSSCEEVTIYSKSETAAKLISEAEKYDHFTIKRRKDGKYSITAYNDDHDYDFPG